MRKNRDNLLKYKLGDTVIANDGFTTPKIVTIIGFANNFDYEVDDGSAFTDLFNEKDLRPVTKLDKVLK